MKYLLIRHAKTDANRGNRTAFGVAGAPISAEGQEQARKLHDVLVARGIDLANTPVAVSELQRTRQTAEVAGLRNLTVNPILNEVNTADPTHTSALLESKRLPDEALMSAEAILANPPEQVIWVTHGLNIMGILEKLGRTDPNHFIPDLCEIVEIEL
jgi:bisphosphoglycerate-dependent phosphoglycerate mutase